MKQFDIEAQMFMFFKGLKEEKNKEYSSKECDNHIAYIFQDEEEFRNYFISNGCTLVYDDEFLSLCKMHITKKGSIIALKGLCDYAIRESKKLGSKSDDCGKKEEKSKSKVLNLNNIEM